MAYTPNIQLCKLYHSATLSTQQILCIFFYLHPWSQYIPNVDFIGRISWFSLVVLLFQQVRSGKKFKIKLKIQPL